MSTNFYNFLGEWTRKKNQISVKKKKLHAWMVAMYLFR